MMKRFMLICGFAALMMVIGAKPVLAQLLKFVGTGVFDSGASLGGTAIADGTAFSFSGLFDPTTDTFGPTDDGVFSATFSINISGVGTYKTAAGGGLNAFFLNSGGLYVAGIEDDSLAHGGDAFFTGSTTPAFNFDVPTPTIFTGWSFAPGIVGMSAPLTGGAGTLTFGSFDVTSAAIVTSAPEGSSIAMLAIGLIVPGYTFIRKRRKGIA